ncbi:ATP-dependent DNA helicase DDX11 [Phoenix dactylifera]|uniref:ATP-dependent DNA helicase DDX11 n=1 Tax=Phoenix dactylifera TaxID=42345 RepID=A0A8B7MUQ9_PHODC|nr:ATP-dependent DNA helicase DDX11 [Phoenix dactylifera]
MGKKTIEEMGEAPEKARREFPAFPFDPYPIQTDFMAFLYDSLEKGGIAMLESPTGTGKTLSIICSTMQWVVDRRKQQREQQKGKPGDTKTSSIDEEEEPDWMRDFAIPGTKKEEGGRRRLGSGLVKSKKASFVKPKNVEKTAEESPGNDEEMEFLVDDYESEAEDMEYGIGRSKRKGGRCLSSSSSDEEEGEGGMEEEEVTPKVYFTSRTHAQLSQFVREFKRTGFTSELNLICLGSRKNLCVNSDVLKLGNSNRINEHCLELQKSKKDSQIKVQTDNGRVQHVKASSGCPMLRKQNLRKQFRTEVWEHGASDIEDLAQLGRKIGTCSYYGAREMVRAGDLVVLPYQSLLLRSARESLGLNLKNSVVVIDEAHNVADSLTSMYNSKITVSQLKQVLSHLELYLGRFRNRLGAGNRRYIQTLIVLIQSFLRLLVGCQEDSSGISNIHADQATEEKNFGDTSMTINEFLFSLNIDNINLVKLHRYVKESNIIHKVTGYGAKFASSRIGSLHSDHQGHGAEGSVISGFQALVGIFLSLINNDSDGRMIVSRQKLSGKTEEGYLKFVMLCGEKIFSEIAGQAHAVVLAGGTLQPIEETRVRLFPGLALDHVHFFTCNHIVPPESLLPIAVSRGPSGMTFDFSYNSRSTPSMIDELGRLLCNLVAVIPEGVVMFFSSFDYEEQVYNTWRASGVLSKILKKKHVYREPRNSIDVDLVLKEYKKAIESPSGIPNDSRTNGALLLAVVGGKISEGINFSDGMGRCIIMVGLPYPSPADVELMERIKYIEGLGEPSSLTPNKSLGNKLYGNTRVQSGFDILRKCKQRGREYYENLCMKAVNQSIGRAIRHINDYAAILLVDSRYACDPSFQSFSHPANKLPLWIKDRLVSATQSYGEVHRLLRQFFQIRSSVTKIISS